MVAVKMEFVTLKISARLAICGLPLVLAGCLSANAEPSSGRNAQARKASPVSSGEGVNTSVVTRQDYEAGVRETEVCLSEANVEQKNFGWDPVGNDEMILLYKSPVMSVKEALEVAEKCQAEHLDAVRAGYQRDNPSFMSPELMKAVQACVRGKGISLTGREKSPTDLMQSVPQKLLFNLVDCVHDAASEMFPKTPIQFP
ncbi:hypothetical protein OHQ88_23230 [Micromonospora zamorensis]|uniref:Lipoprotein n=1 Tax=Micromonospora zamorensis TaxID=709883 RepID=A0ABZ1PAB3_9ACTN